MDDTQSESGEHAEVLEAVGNETRVGIIKALVDHRRDDPRDPGLPFSELRDRVGMGDSGQFNYHLDKLRGAFVEGVDGEYRLTYAGRKLATTLVTEAFKSEYEEGPVTYGGCPRGSCEAMLVAAYEGGTVSVECEAEHVAFRTGLPPMAAAERSMDEILTLVTRTLYHDVDLASAEICPRCYGEMVTRVAEARQGKAVPYTFEAVCQHCGFLSDGAAGILLLSDPEVGAFFTTHGRDIREEYPWRLDFISKPDCYTCRSRDPLRIEIDVAVAGDGLRVTVANTAEIMETDYRELEGRD